MRRLSSSLRKPFGWALGPLLLAILGCESSPPKAENPLVAEIEQQRRQKDRSFKHDADSPIPADQKANFNGLSYFPIDLKYRIELKLNKNAQADTLKILTSAGVERAAIKYGYFAFDLDAQPCALQVYKLLDIQSKYPNYLFLPFLDATSGKESYGGGRYLDFEENDTGIYTLDFNIAYSPSCAYGKSGYRCPIPPAENRLHLAVKAGERYSTNQ
ncbi:MAG TPA: DUF1684 domain-containing protein [bacterium]